MVRRPAAIWWTWRWGRRRRRRWAGIVSEPLPEQAESQPVEEARGGLDAFAGAGGRAETEEAGFCTLDGFGEVINLIFNQIHDGRR